MMPDLAPDMVPDINKCCWCQIVPDWASGICSGSVTEIVQHLFRKFAGYCAGYDTELMPVLMPVLMPENIYILLDNIY